MAPLDFGSFKFRYQAVESWHLVLSRVPMYPVARQASRPQHLDQPSRTDFFVCEQSLYPTP